MKLLGKSLSVGGPGTVKLLPQTHEDMWHIYNLITVGDQVTAVSFPKVKKESSTGSSTTSRIKMTLTVLVESTEWDAQTCSLRLRGKTISENDFIKLGSYQTLELGGGVHRQKPFTLEKEEWDSVSVERVDDAINPAKSAEVAAVVMEQGLAHVCLITQHMTLVQAKIEVPIPRKRGGSNERHRLAISKFYTAVANAIERNIDFKEVKCIVVASPGFVKDDFFAFMMSLAQKRNQKELLESKSKFLLVHSSTGQKHALKEALASPAVKSKIQDTKAYREVKVLEQFFDLLHTDPDRSMYGLKHCQRSADMGAIDKLLVTDELFRSSDVAVRKTYLALVETVKEAGGTVHLFSQMHVSGEQLLQLTGVAAILRFPVNLEEEEGLSFDDNDGYDSEAGGGV